MPDGVFTIILCEFACSASDSHPFLRGVADSKFYVRRISIFFSEFSRDIFFRNVFLIHVAPVFAADSAAFDIII